MAENSNVFAALAHGLGLLLLFIPALIIWLIKKDEDEYVATQCKRAMNFQITVFIASVVSSILTIVLIGLILLPAVGIIFIVFTIIAIIKTVNTEDYEYPKWTSIPIFK